MGQPLSRGTQVSKHLFVPFASLFAHLETVADACLLEAVLSMIVIGVSRTVSPQTIGSGLFSIVGSYTILEEGLLSGLHPPFVVFKVVTMFEQFEEDSTGIMAAVAVGPSGHSMVSRR